MTKRRQPHRHHSSGNMFRGDGKPVAAHFNDTAERATSSFMKKHGKQGARKNQQGK